MSPVAPVGPTGPAGPEGPTMAQSSALSAALHVAAAAMIRSVPSFATHPWIRVVSPPWALTYITEATSARTPIVGRTIVAFALMRTPIDTLGTVARRADECHIQARRAPSRLRRAKRAILGKARPFRQ